MRKLLDNGRDAFAQRAHFPDRESMKKAHGFESSKKYVAEALCSNSFSWTEGSQATVRFAVENTIRFHGNTAVHRFSPEEIMGAIELVPFGRERMMLSELHSYLYRTA